MNQKATKEIFIIKLIRCMKIFSVTLLKWYIMKISKNWVIWDSLPGYWRARLWRLVGCKIARKVNIGYDVYFDASNAKNIIIEDGVWIASRALLLAHRRDLSNYYIDDDINTQPYLIKDIIIRKGAHIGMGTIIMPGVEIGEGAIIGAGSVVTKSIPPWTIACGVPCKVQKKITRR